MFRDQLVFVFWSYIDPLCYAKSLQSSPTLCDPIDGSPPGSPVHGILQARTLEWVAIAFSNAWKWKVKVTLLSHLRLLVTPWTAAHQAPPSMGFSRQEYWSGVPLPSQYWPPTDLLLMLIISQLIFWKSIISSINNDACLFFTMSFFFKLLHLQLPLQSIKQDC